MYLFRCNSTDWDKVVFRNLLACNNEKGTVCVNCASVHLDDILLVNNRKVGIELNISNEVTLCNSTSGSVHTVSGPLEKSAIFSVYHDFSQSKNECFSNYKC